MNNWHKYSLFNKKKKNLINSYPKNDNNSEEATNKLLEITNELLIFEDDNEKRIKYLELLQEKATITNENEEEIGDYYFSLYSNDKKSVDSKKFLLISKKNYELSFSKKYNEKIKNKLSKVLNILLNINLNREEEIKILESFISLDKNNSDYYLRLGNIYNDIHIENENNNLKFEDDKILKIKNLEKSKLNYEQTISKFLIDIKNNKNYTSPKKNKLSLFIYGSSDPIKRMTKGLLLSMIKSGLFWVICVFTPMLLFLLFFLSGSYSHAPMNSTFQLLIINYCIITPFIMLGIIVFPRYLLVNRENNLFKRMVSNGTTKIQIYISYMLISFILLFLWTIFMLGPFILAEIEIINSSLENDTYEYKDIFKNFSPQLFYLVLFSGYIFISSYGYKKGMKSKSSGKITSIGTGIWIFISIALSSGLRMFHLSFSDIINWSSSLEGMENILVVGVLFIFKFIYIINPISLFSMAISITSVGELWNYGSVPDGFEFSSQELLYWFTIISSISISLFVFLRNSFKYYSITNFEITR